MLYYLPQYFLIQKGILTKQKYEEIKKSIEENEKKEEQDIHIDTKYETPKLYYLEKYKE